SGAAWLSRMAALRARSPRRAARRRQRRGGASAVAPERPELVADEVRGRDEHDRDRLRDDLAESGLDENRQDREIPEIREQRDDEEAQALEAEVTARMPEGPEPVPEIVVRHGH